MLSPSAYTPKTPDREVILRRGSPRGSTRREMVGDILDLTGEPPATGPYIEVILFVWK